MIHIGRAGAQLGVFSEDEVSDGLRRGRFSPTDLGWKEGMGAWAPLSEFAELSSPPPLPDEDTPAVIDLAPLPEGLPWERRGELGIVRAFFATVQVVLLKPGEAFTQMRKDGALTGPLLYNIIGGWIGGVANSFWMLAMAHMPQPSYDLEWERRLFTVTPERAMQQLETAIFLAPLIVTFATLCGAAIWHLLLMICGGANKSFHVTLRTLCYVQGSASVLQLIPMLGGLVATVWVFVLCIIGLARAHETTTTRTLVAAGLAMLASVVCCIGLVMFAVSIVQKAAGSQ